MSDLGVDLLGEPIEPEAKAPGPTELVETIARVVWLEHVNDRLAGGDGKVVVSWWAMMDAVMARHQIRPKAWGKDCDRRLLEAWREASRKGYGIVAEAWPDEHAPLGEDRVQDGLNTKSFTATDLFFAELIAALKEHGDAGFRKFATVVIRRLDQPPLRDRIIAYAEEHPDADFGTVWRAFKSTRQAATIMRELEAEGIISLRSLLST